MRRVLLGLACGIALASTAHGEEPAVTRLSEVTMDTTGRTAFMLPSRYGRLVNVVVSSEVHYLYFEDPVGTIRIVLVGPRSALSRSRNQLQLLSPDVAFIKRGTESDGP